MLRYNSIKFSRRFINGQLNNELNLLHFISLDLFQELNFHVTLQISLFQQLAKI